MRGKVVLITGASSGIGAGTAVYLASRGCLLSLTGRSQEGLRETLRDCMKAGAKKEQILLIPADLEVFENLAVIVDRTVEKFGRLDVLVNNAGCSKITQLENATVEDYDLIMNTNLKSVFFLTQKAMPHLIESKGSVVNVSSVAGQRPITSVLVYGMTKAALDHFTRVVALDVAAKGVRVNTVSPGMVKTQISSRWGIVFPFEELSKASHALGRAGTLEEMAKAIAFLADNEQSSFITGVTMLVDGGSALMGPL